MDKEVRESYNVSFMMFPGRHWIEPGRGGILWWSAVVVLENFTKVDIWEQRGSNLNTTMTVKDFLNSEKLQNINTVANIKMYDLQYMF